MQVQPMLLQASAIKKASFREVGGFPSGLRTREDTLLFYKLGLRYPACAVAERGTVMTADGGGRLTEEWGSRTLVYKQATLDIYEEMFHFAAEFRPEFRSFFQDQTSRAYYSLARYFFKTRAPLQLAKYLAMAAGKSPFVFYRSVWDSIGSRLGTVRS
jgi:hypothetical protein